ncbi:hypothetical protein PoB_001228300 [Plakobranchus ocellatus]|uniref:Uncharacterized protein n=1 Tax=Plakobranchus ocellatus TaxID=259542 RepID=A0AAV3YU69_9GAST|nr:hypothetical protein PoB_001228300 [Plakobranchus ocellatus]
MDGSLELKPATEKISQIFKTCPLSLQPPITPSLQRPCSPLRFTSMMEDERHRGQLMLRQFNQSPVNSLPGLDPRPLVNNLGGRATRCVTATMKTYRILWRFCL